jgi:hypothetical protein
VSVAAEVEVVDASTVRPKRAKKASTAPVQKAEPVVRDEPGATGGVKYVARRPLKIGAKKFKPGDAVPEAASWTRVEAWVRSGYIEEVEI